MPTSRNSAPSASNRLDPSSQAWEISFAVLHHAGGGDVAHSDRLPELDLFGKILFEGFHDDVGGDGFQVGRVDKRCGSCRPADWACRSTGRYSKPDLAGLLERTRQVLLGRRAGACTIARQSLFFRWPH